MTNEQRLLAVKFAMETLGLQSPTGQAQVLQTPAQPAPSSQHTVPSVPAPQSDIKTFTTMKAPKTDTQFAAVVAYFYQFEAPSNQRRESINDAAMKEAARLAGRRQAPKWKFTLQNARNAGYLDAAGDGNYKLSPVGENLVAITLPGNAVGGKGNGVSKKKKKSAKSKPGKKG